MMIVLKLSINELHLKILSLDFASRQKRITNYSAYACYPNIETSIESFVTYFFIYLPTATLSGLEITTNYILIAV